MGAGQIRQLSILVLKSVILRWHYAQPLSAPIILDLQHKHHLAEATMAEEVDLAEEGEEVPHSYW